jgi:MoaA/NifB/PqqE/SkfB family radical SAM enzyme
VGIYFVGFLGGEPLLRKDLLPLLARYKDIAFRISTNGTLLEETDIAWLKRLGNVVLFFSLEGCEEETDAWRGRGVFRRITDTMRRLREERILFGFSALLHARNGATVVSRAFLDAMDRLGNTFGLFFPYGPVGRNQYFDLVIEESKLDALFRELDALQAEYPMLLLKEGYRAPDGDPRLFLEQGCRAGVTIHVTTAGYAEPCNGIQFHTENVLEKGLLRVFRSPFYRDVFACVIQNGSRCIALFEPDKVLALVEKHEARPSNPVALACCRRYAAVRRGRRS